MAETIHVTHATNTSYASKPSRRMARSMEIMEAGGRPFAGYMRSNNSEVYSVFQNFDTLTYIIRGGLKHYNHQDTFIAKAGDLFFTSKYSDYKAKRLLDVKTHDYVSIGIGLFEDCAVEIPSNGQWAACNFKTPSEPLHKLFEQLRNAYDAQQSWSEAQYLSWKDEVYHILRTQYALQLGALQRVRNDGFMSFLHQHITQNITLETLAKRYGASVSSFQRYFKKRLGVSPHKWIKDQRLHHARFQMQFTQKPISEIYLDLGFEDLGHFSKEFKRKFGYSPSSTYGSVSISVLK